MRIKWNPHTTYQPDLAHLLEEAESHPPLLKNCPSLLMWTFSGPSHSLFIHPTISPPIHLSILSWAREEGKVRMTQLLTSESSQFQPHGLSLIRKIQERATMKKP